MTWRFRPLWAPSMDHEVVSLSFPTGAQFGRVVVELVA
jgi:hypothetical protein